MADNNPFDGPYNGTFHMVQDTGVAGPAYTIGGMDKLRQIAKSGRLRALMITKVDAKATWMTPQRPAVTLQEILDSLPSTMLFGSIAWMELEGEEEPTTAIIYAGMDIAGLRMLTYARLYTSLKRNEDGESFQKKLREKAYIESAEQIIKNPEPLATLIVQHE
jgi:hypothetical protein